MMSAGLYFTYRSPPKSFFNKAKRFLHNGSSEGVEKKRGRNAQNEQHFIYLMINDSMILLQHQCQ